MFSTAVLHLPTEEKARLQIYKDISDFRNAAIVDYIESLSLNEKQLDTLIAYLAKSTRQEHGLVEMVSYSDS